MKKRYSDGFIQSSGGFTLIELMVVIMILSIAALVAVPMLGSSADVQARSAASTLAADLDYARGLAVTHQENIMVVFSPSTESYSIRDSAGAVVAHPLGTGDFTMDFTAEPRLSKVDMVSSNFDGETTLTFDYLGAPYSGAVGSCTAMNTGRITLQADTFTMYVDVEPVTGYITITQP